MKKFVLAPSLAALAMFLWGFVYYGLSGIPYRTLEKASALPAFLAPLSADGAYLFPDPRDGAEAMAKASETGPVAMVHYRKVPRPMGETMALGYLHEFICCVLLAFVLMKCEPAFKGFSCRFMFAVAVGVLITFFSQGAEAIWWQQSWSWHLATMFYDVVAWAIAGAVLAKFFTPKLT
ncbi:MAG: hypothetical protein C0518_13805 [Opitutus sp.]|nr:hypothetical protein [Opitutus sp.]